MTTLDIPDLNISATITKAVIEGGSSSVLDEIPDEYRLAWRVDVGTDPTKAQMRIFGEVVILRVELEALNASKPLAQMAQRALARNTAGLLRQKIKTQIQELFRKEPTP